MAKKEKKSFMDRVREAIADHNMVQSGSEVVTALSGGADSVSLLYSLKMLSEELGIKVSACHINHMLRGDESDRDMNFCQDLCEGFNVKLIVLKTDVLSAKLKHESVEECARRIRYDFFKECSAGKKLATAHTLSDSAETIFLNMLRGTGLKGLCGIPPVRGNLIRPLIYCTREDVENFCTENNLRFVTDSTNLTNDATRNKIRHIIIPELLKINGSFYENLLRMEKNLCSDSAYLEKLTESAVLSAKTDGGYNASLIAGLAEPLAGRVVKKILLEGEVEPSSLRIKTALEIIRSGQGKFNPCLNKFFVVRRGKAYVETSRQIYKKRQKDPPTKE